MDIRYYSDSAMDLIGSVLFPKAHPSVRRRHLRFLSLSILLGLMFCLAFGAMLFVLNRQGRI